MKEIDSVYKKGILSIEQNLARGTKVCDFGIQTARDGRVWICVDGMALIRFRPEPRKEERK